MLQSSHPLDYPIILAAHRHVWALALLSQSQVRCSHIYILFEDSTRMKTEPQHQPYLTQIGFLVSP
jgi:hypothetical protein